MEASHIYRSLAARFGYEDSPDFLRLLQFLMSEAEANLAAALPASVEELSARLGVPAEDARRELDDMFRRGLVFPRNFYTGEGARFARSLVQLHDATQSALSLDPEKDRELYDMWEAFCLAGYDRDYALGYLKLDKPHSRVVPAYKAVKDCPELQPYEDVREFLKAAERLAVVSCSCRKRAQAEHRPCEKSHDRNCIQFNRGAEYAIVRGSGRELSLDEALNIVDETEEHGLVHSWFNSRSMVGVIMCNCCYDCCVDWARLRHHGVPISTRWEKSRFEARIDTRACTGCQTCVERCQFEAIAMTPVPGSKKLKATVDPEKCWGCGVCALGCAADAIRLDLVRPLEHIPDVAAP